LPAPEAADTARPHPFKGNIDLQALERTLERERGNVPLVVITITNNSGGGQPVALDNVRRAGELCRRHGVKLYIDAARFAENAYFIKQREPDQGRRAVIDIARELLRLGDGCTMSAKKDGLANMGGFIGTNDDALAEAMRNQLILTEGFTTYGGLSGRDLEAIARGLYEALDEDYLTYRIRSTAYLGEHIVAAGVPILEPPGGHAIYIDAAAMLPHIPPSAYPGQALACELYMAGGVRSCEIGSVMFGKRDPESGVEHPARMELVRLALPRRVYTQSHVDYLIEVVSAVQQERHELRGMRIVSQPERLRHFSARFAPL
jgi:tryptophanase